MAGLDLRPDPFREAPGLAPASARKYEPDTPVARGWKLLGPCPKFPGVCERRSSLLREAAARPKQPGLLCWGQQGHRRHSHLYALVIISGIIVPHNPTLALGTRQLFARLRPALFRRS